MPHTQVPADSIGGRAEAVRPAFVCAGADGGLDAAWVYVAGELDLVAVPRLERTLDQPQLQARLVVLDLRELEFMDSCGMLAIVNAGGHARGAGRRLVLLRGPPTVDRLFTLTGCSDELRLGDLDPGEPPVRVLLQFAEGDRAS
ncbi:hypothetical protein AYO39_01665 [Actinobacteria bacterium SCGC AG-212-D09]|nr:hypothetical protein AYO39_01665 [Actinobacteria bacterium SCGC AG-212-D09]